VPDTTTTINRDQRDGLYEVIRNHLALVQDFWVAMERTKDGAMAERLGLEFAEDFRLLQDIGWCEKDERETFDLTMPEHDLMELLQRLQGEAVDVLVESGAEVQASRGRRRNRSALPGRLRGLQQAPERSRPARGGSRPGRAAPLRGGSGPVARTEARRERVAVPVGTERLSRRPPFPEQIPPGLNHLVLTGTLLEKPHEARRCGHDAPAWVSGARPRAARDLWTLARCEVEVPAALARRSVSSLHVGVPCSHGVN
jgi:hypothetical protein